MLVIRRVHQNRLDKVLSWVFLLPVFLVLAMAAFVPLGYGLGLSFTNFTLGEIHTHFIGLANYVELLKSQLFQQAVRNNVLFAVMAVGLEMIFGTIVAMIISQDSRLNRAVTTVALIPMVIAPVAAGILFRMMLDQQYGVVDYLLSLVGLPRIGWLSDYHVAIYSIVMVDLWQFTPYVAILVVSSIKAIPKSFIEAALVDGASLGKIFRIIILPIISPVLIVVAMIRFIDAFKVFGTVYTMTQGGPGNATLMLPNYIYEQGVNLFRVGFSTASAFVFILAMFILAFFFIRFRTLQLRRLGQ